MPRSFQPIGGRIVVEKPRVQRTSKGGILLVSRQDRKWKNPNTGVVLAVGPEVTVCRLGDRIVFTPYGHVAVEWEGESPYHSTDTYQPEKRYVVMSQGNVLGIIDECYV